MTRPIVRTDRVQAAADAVERHGITVRQATILLGVSRPEVECELMRRERER